jgi:hypothetical protein
MHSTVISSLKTMSFDLKDGKEIMINTIMTKSATVSKPL